MCDPYWCSSCGFRADGLVHWAKHAQSPSHLNTIRLHGFPAVQQVSPFPPQRPKWLPEAISQPSLCPPPPPISRHKANIIIACKTKTGSIELQSLIQRDATQAADIATVLEGSLLELSKDRFANYVIQRLVLILPSFRSRLVAEISGAISKLSKNSAASRVVEALLQYSESRRIIIQELCSNPSETMLIDRTANYVLQTAFQHADNAELELLQQVWREYLHRVKNPSVKNKWTQLFAVQRACEDTDA